MVLFSLSPRLQDNRKAGDFVSRWEDGGFRVGVDRRSFRSVGVGAVKEKRVMIEDIMTVHVTEAELAHDLHAVLKKSPARRRGRHRGG